MFMDVCGDGMFTMVIRVIEVSKVCLLVEVEKIPCWVRFIDGFIDR